jgi:predicted RNase H-like HicB family nuclease
MKLTVEFEQETDGRWIAEVPELPGVVVYGVDRTDAFRKVGILAFRVMADRLEHWEDETPREFSLVFPAA